MKKKVLKKTLRIAGIVFLLLFVLFPLYWLVISSLKYSEDIYTVHPSLFPNRIRLSNYVDIWKTIPMAKYYKNSLIVSVSSMILATIVATFAGYALSKFKFPGRKTVGVTFLVTQMFPGILFLLPYYLIFIFIKNTLGIPLIGTYPGLIITYTAFVGPFAIWVMRGYFDTVPSALREAALIDGCGNFRAFTKIILPAAKPGIATVAILSFMKSWNEVLFATVLTNNGTRTLPLGLYEFQQEFMTSWNLVMAAGIVISIPVLIFFIFLQKYFVSGFTSGAVKG
ncbi:MAG: multiple sugar transport system permease protein [Kosmotoga sp.]|jgi:multiple sugar transport system permease protein|nr:multiple sugar transport system permease protein [Kosmotoga sp.]